MERRKRGSNKKNWCEIYLLPKHGTETETETETKKIKNKNEGQEKSQAVFVVGGEWKVKNLKGHKLINH